MLFITMWQHYVSAQNLNKIKKLIKQTINRNQLQECQKTQVFKIHSLLNQAKRRNLALRVIIKSHILWLQLFQVTKTLGSKYGQKIDKKRTEQRKNKKKMEN